MKSIIICFGIIAVSLMGSVHPFTIAVEEEVQAIENQIKNQVPVNSEEFRSWLEVQGEETVRRIMDKIADPNDTVMQHDAKVAVARYLVNVTFAAMTRRLENYGKNIPDTPFRAEEPVKAIPPAPVVVVEEMVNPEVPPVVVFVEEVKEPVEEVMVPAQQQTFSVVESLQAPVEETVVIMEEISHPQTPSPALPISGVLPPNSIHTFYPLIPVGSPNMPVNAEPPPIFLHKAEANETLPVSSPNETETATIIPFWQQFLPFNVSVPNRLPFNFSLPSGAGRLPFNFSLAAIRGEGGPRLPFNFSLPSAGEGGPRLPFNFSLPTGGEGGPRLPFNLSLPSRGEGGPRLPFNFSLPGAGEGGPRLPFNFSLPGSGEGGPRLPFNFSLPGSNSGSSGPRPPLNFTLPGGLNLVITNTNNNNHNEASSNSSDMDGGLFNNLPTLPPEGLFNYPTPPPQNDSVRLSQMFLSNQVEKLVDGINMQNLSTVLNSTVNIATPQTIGVFVNALLNLVLCSPLDRFYGNCGLE